ncbi:uncharacterized protein LOC122577461 isoform X3 [Bombus pyrosoma]|uniref:uncharacterized protein LOC122577461 isoform X2 n=1 Tax=Bombus pyrosoma TaxID=396416 RepID=UPI001CB8B00A|nr:uncharacterized protein LOC122577461 isoform X2 [Bombus pyrosoma]XP_043604725.1 uncharacterized protein LOC122577461 isoform X3 [Bombus pyrosoma]
MCVLYVVMRSFGGYVRYCKLNKLFLVLVFIFFLCGCRLCWLWTWKYLHLFNLYTQEEKGFPKMCGWLVKTIQMNVRRLTSLRRLLPESWIFSCVTVLVVVAIMILNGEYRGVLVKGSLCRLSHARGRRVPKYVSGPRRCRQEQNIV